MEPEVGILFVVGVPAGTVGFVALELAGYQAGLPPATVLFTGDGLEVGGIHAVSDATEMVELQPFGDWADKRFVG